ncbi:Os04g0470801 [Oryza sativa Japonica Group]|uniref:Os04g0470801 protein n=1 Tax=Oryza sativa subsp. japonica TaxID=39947 RepID=A0A0N7KJ76_ORYSJ|nr:hypothetical protein EE612_023874 [Oryza sativa]BAS89641.1 Os04g0470801 [Oryza sativa Japonica Group]
MALDEVHLHGEVDGERPEVEGAEQREHLVEVGEGERHRRGARHVHRPEAHPQEVHPTRRQQRQLHRVEVVHEPARRFYQCTLKWFLGAVYLVAAEQVEDDAGVGEVDEPVGLVEAEAGEEVARGVAPEGGVAEAAAAEVEEGGDDDRDDGRLLHHFQIDEMYSYVCT